jgi:hypothetical protein
MIGVMVGGVALGTEVVFLEVEQFPADHFAGKVKEMPDRLQLHVGQREMQPEQGVLKDVVGLLPAAERGIAVKHLPGELQEPAAGVFDQERVCLRVARPGKLDELLEPGVAVAGHRAGPCRHRGG